MTVFVFNSSMVKMTYSSYGISWVFIDENGNRVSAQKYLTSF